MKRSVDLERRLEVLRESYLKVNGQSFEHFLCPLTLRDDSVELCEGHLLNKCFPDTSRRWTVQRTDVDNWFGRNFEGDFSFLRYQDLTIEEIFTSETTAKDIHLQLTHEGQEVGHYRPRGQVPAHHTKVDLMLGTRSVRLALKFEPNEMLRTRSEDWDFSFEKDIRLPALVSLLKAAHLTCFDMLGYEYALSAGGLFLGHTILGQFYIKNCDLPKDLVQKSAIDHFAEYISLVRPVLKPDIVIGDTISEGDVYIVEGLTRWGLLVCLRISGSTHAVIVPMLESDDSAARFVAFLKSDGCILHVRKARFDGRAFQVAPETRAVYWPPSRFK